MFAFQNKSGSISWWRKPKRTASLCSRTAACFPASPRWCTTTAPVVGCLSLAPCTWPWCTHSGYMTSPQGQIDMCHLLNTPNKHSSHLLPTKGRLIKPQINYSPLSSHFLTFLLVFQLKPEGFALQWTYILIVIYRKGVDNFWKMNKRLKKWGHALFACYLFLMFNIVEQNTFYNPT